MDDLRKTSSVGTADTSHGNNIALRRNTSSKVELEAQELLESLFRDSNVLDAPLLPEEGQSRGGARPPPPSSRDALPIEASPSGQGRSCNLCGTLLIVGEVERCDSCLAAKQGATTPLSDLSQEEAARSARRMQRLSLLAAGRAEELRDRVGRPSLRGDFGPVPVSRPPLIRGELWKRNREERGAFKKRYFMQSGSFLYYLRSANDVQARDRFALPALREVSKHIDSKWGLCCALVFPERVLLVTPGKNAQGPEVREWIDRFLAWQKWFEVNPDDSIPAADQTIAYEPQQKKGWKVKWLSGVHTPADDEPTIPAKKDTQQKGGGADEDSGSKRSSPRFLSIGRRQGTKVSDERAESSFPGIRLRDADQPENATQKPGGVDEAKGVRLFSFRTRGGSVSKDEPAKRDSPRGDESESGQASSSSHTSPRSSPRNSQQKSRAGSITSIHPDTEETSPRSSIAKARAGSANIKSHVDPSTAIQPVALAAAPRFSAEPAMGSPRSLASNNNPSADPEPPIPRKSPGPFLRKTADPTPSTGVQKIPALKKRSDVTPQGRENVPQDSPDAKAERQVELARLRSRTDLDISMMGLTRLAPGCLVGLPNVRYLDVSFNQLRTWPEDALLPVAGHIQVLVMAGCGLELVPKAIKLLPQLRELVLSGNGLLSLPPEIASCRKLQTLNLSDNRLQNLPASIGYLSRLEELFVRGNPALAALPASIGNLRELQILDASSCRLTSLPEEIVYCTQLMDLNLRANQLHSLPARMGWLRKLISLNVALNMLADVPVSLGLCENLNHTGLGLNVKGNPIQNQELLSQDGAEQIATYLAHRCASSGGALVLQGFPTSWPYVSMEPFADLPPLDEIHSPGRGPAVTALPQPGRTNRAVRSAIETVIVKQLFPLVSRFQGELERIDSLDGRALNVLGRRLKAMRVDVEALIAIGRLNIKAEKPEKDEVDKLRYMKLLLSFHLQRFEAALKLTLSTLLTAEPAQVVEIGKAVGRLKIAATTEL